MAVGQRAGTDRRMPRARDGVHVRVGGVAEPGPLGHEALEARAEPVSVVVEVLCAHLIDDQHDDERMAAAGERVAPRSRRRRTAGGRDEERRQQRDERVSDDA